MKKLGLLFFAFLLICLASSTASAATLTLFEWATNIDGTIVDNFSTLPGSFNPATGLGILTITSVSGAGPHSAIAFFDYEIDEIDNTYFNEYGTAVGAPEAGQSWEIDEPGYVFGDIFSNFSAGTLDNSNGVPAISPDDVSMAMGWNFVLASDEIATIRFFLDDSLPVGAAPPAFYLKQTDPRSQADIFLWSDINIRSGGEPPIPEPSTIVLVLSGLGLAVAAKFRKSA